MTPDPCQSLPPQALRCIPIQPSPPEAQLLARRRRAARRRRCRPRRSRRSHWQRGTPRRLAPRRKALKVPGRMGTYHRENGEGLLGGTLSLFKILKGNITNLTNFPT